MTIQEKQQIGIIAMNATATIKISDLAKMLNVKTPAAAGQKVSAAWNYFYRNKQQNICDKIAQTFVDKNGKYAYEKYK